MRCAIYLRISDPSKGQTPENQRAPLETFRDEQRWKPGPVYVDQDSAFRADSTRPAFNQMLADAEKHKFDILLFWALDRFSRGGSFETLYYLNQLTRFGVKVRSFTEPFLDTSTPMGEANVALLAALAKQESVRKSERVRAGMARARAAGRRVGGRKRTVTLEQFRKLNKVLGVRELMENFKISRAMVYKLRAELHWGGAAKGAAVAAPADDTKILPVVTEDTPAEPDEWM